MADTKRSYRVGKQLGCRVSAEEYDRIRAMATYRGSSANYGPIIHEALALLWETIQKEPRWSALHPVAARAAEQDPHGDAED